MILLDTNVLSAVMSPNPGTAIIDWLNHQEAVTLHLSTITIAEIGYGLWVMPDGKRRRHVEDRFERFVAEGFDQRILDFDPAATRLYAEVMGRRRSIGRPMSVTDGQIAAIARARHLALATRNIRNFEECGIDLINPFEGRTQG